MTAAGQENIVDVLSSDHRAVLQLLDRLVAAAAAGLVGAATPADEGAREQLVIELVRHFVAEEQYLYPLLRRTLSGGDRLAEAAFKQHRTCEHALRALEHPQAPAELASTLASVRELVGSHITEQESQLFPALVTAVDDEELVELAEQVLGAEQLAPTRPRMVAASNPALNKFSSIVEGFIDHVRDSYSHRGVDDETD